MLELEKCQLITRISLPVLMSCVTVFTCTRSCTHSHLHTLTSVHYQLFHFARLQPPLPSLRGYSFCQKFNFNFKMSSLFSTFWLFSQNANFETDFVNMDDAQNLSWLFMYETFKFASYYQAKILGHICLCMCCWKICCKNVVSFNLLWDGPDVYSQNKTN